MSKNALQTLLKSILVIASLYFFLVSIGLMGVAFKGFGKEFAENLIRTTSNPLIGLFIGILATSIVQSSSTTTSIVVGMVAYGVITVNNAIPIVMGANIGTTVTGILVSLGHIGRREEFKRAVGGGTLDGFFKMMCVCIIFPLEMAFGFLEKSAKWMTGLFAGYEGVSFTSPVKLVTSPAVHIIESIVMKLQLSAHAAYILLLVISLVLLFAALYFITKMMGALVAKRAEIVLNNVIGKYGIVTVFATLFFTAIIQSSSITIALMIPLLAAGILNLEAMYPMVMGANIGTTVTAILASLATGSVSALTVAFAHFIFNVIGVCVIYPIKPLRKIPLFLASGLGDIGFKKRRYVILYVLVAFFLIPGLFIAISKFIK